MPYFYRPYRPRGGNTQTPPTLSVLPYQRPGAPASHFAANPSVVEAPYGYDSGGAAGGMYDDRFFGPHIGGEGGGGQFQQPPKQAGFGMYDDRFFGPHIGGPGAAGGRAAGPGAGYDDRFFGPHIGGPMGANQTPGGFWMPRALQQQTPQLARQQARESRVNARKMRQAAGGGGGSFKPINWSYSGSTMPPGAGTGGYYPGTSGEAQNQVRQNAVAAFQQYAQGKGLSPRQIQQTVAQIASGGAVGGGGGGGGVGPQAGKLFEAMQSQTDAANRANEERYEDTLAGYWDRYMRGIQNMMGAGQQEAADINEAAQGQGAALRQGLTARGLSNSTIMDNMNAGVERERRADQGRLQERLRNQFAQLDASLSGDVLGVMERRDDVQPDYGQFLQLAQMLGVSGLDGGMVQQGGGGIPSLMGMGMPILGDNPFVGPGAFAGMIPRAGTSHRLSPGGRGRMNARKENLAGRHAPWAGMVPPGVPIRPDLT